MSEIKELQKLAGISVNEDTDIGHKDDEKSMLASDLYHIGVSTIDIFKMLKQLPEDSDFPHWWQSKVIKAKEYIQGAKDYLDAEINKPDDVELQASDKISDNQDPSGVS